MIVHTGNLRKSQPGYPVMYCQKRTKFKKDQKRKPKRRHVKVLSFTPVAALSSLVALLLQLNIACLLCGKCNGKGKMIPSGPPSCRRHPVTGLWSVHKGNFHPDYRLHILVNWASQFLIWRHQMFYKGNSVDRHVARVSVNMLIEYRPICRPILGRQVP